VRAKLLRWYGREKRNFPWRGETDPYRIWVSEVMLQQTQAAAVVDRYPRFLERFPTAASLADAPLEAVLSEWQGMGYYTRARNLHRAARIVAGLPGSKLPRGREALIQLPGFGPYMAGAVSSIAFGERAAAVDGNAVRVLSRLLNLGSPVGASPGKETLEKEAEALVPPSRPGDFNQAVMDLGAGVCLPRHPRCQACPLARDCAALAAGTAPLLPVKTKKKPPKKVTLFQLWAERRGAILMVRREDEGLFGGMWELPGLMIDGRPEGPDRRALGGAIRKLLGPGWRAGAKIARITRTLTHRKILFIVLRAEKSGGKIPQRLPEGTLWANENDLAALPVSAAQRAAIVAAREALSDRQGNLFA
jgi:A/G-specific adenine glycosylase